MTTAARPTFDPARGGTGRSENDLGALSKQYSSRDLPGHTKLKYRQDGQNSATDVKNRDFRRELEDRERQSRDKRDRGRGESGNASSSSNTKRLRIEQAPASNIDADDPVDDEDDEDDDSDGEDDTAALHAELEKIRRERAADASRKEAERKMTEEKIRMENILKGNPLINQEKSDFKVRRRWDDDVVFKNCASGDERKKDRTFINDSLRSEFHKKFMEKYIK